MMSSVFFTPSGFGIIINKKAGYLVIIICGNIGIDNTIYSLYNQMSKTAGKGNGLPRLAEGT